MAQTYDNHKIPAENLRLLLASQGDVYAKYVYGEPVEAMLVKALFNMQGSGGGSSLVSGSAVLGEGGWVDVSYPVTSSTRIVVSPDAEAAGQVYESTALRVDGVSFRIVSSDDSDAGLSVTYFIHG